MVICHVRNTAVSQPAVVSLGRAPPDGGSTSGAAILLTHSKQNRGAAYAVKLRLDTKQIPRTEKIRFGVFVVHRKEFESLAFGSVDQRSIQLS